MRRMLVLATCGLAMTLVPATVAASAGGPVPAWQNGAGASAPGGRVSYVAVAAGRHATVVERVRRRDGFVLDSRLLRGQLGVPGAAYDGSTTGLSADGRTLVLAAFSTGFPVKRTQLVLMDAHRLRVRSRVTLAGWFTVDAISRDGRSLFLIQYPSNGDVLHYGVRAYDVPARRLVRRPVVDPREPDEAMQGVPQQRVMSADGRWAYTLYDRPEGKPFLHALDTTGRTARCIDLPYFVQTSQSPVRMSLADGGRQLRIRNDVQPLATVNTRTFAFREPTTVSVSKPAPARAAATHAGTGARWVIAIVVVGLAAGAALALVAGRRRRRRAPHDVGISVEVR